jgi:hypothetical protein
VGQIPHCRCSLLGLHTAIDASVSVSSTFECNFKQIQEPAENNR